jgi:hypothetical protein
MNVSGFLPAGDGLYERFEETAITLLLTLGGKRSADGNRFSAPPALLAARI